MDDKVWNRGYGLGEEKWRQLLAKLKDSLHPYLILPSKAAFDEAAKEDVQGGSEFLSPGPRLVTSYLTLQASLLARTTPSGVLTAAATGVTIVCCMPDSSDPSKVCGGVMDIAVDWKGAYYRCQTDPTSHKVPV